MTPLRDCFCAHCRPLNELRAELAAARADAQRQRQVAVAVSQRLVLCAEVLGTLAERKECRKS